MYIGKETVMDSWIFQIARKICMVAFGANIFIHAIIGASAVDGIVKGTLSMGAMLLLLFVLSGQDLKRRIGKGKKKKKKSSGSKIYYKEDIENE